MKKMFLAALVLMSAVVVNAQTVTADQVAKFNTENYNFGKIKQNVPVVTYFEITNVSDKPLVVENAWGSCGCTTPEKPEQPILPGQTAKLKVQYSGAGTPGSPAFTKDVYVKFAGIEQPKNVKITMEVVDEPTYDAYVKEKEASEKVKTKGKSKAKG